MSQFSGGLTDGHVSCVPSTERKVGSCGPKAACRPTQENVQHVEEASSSQEDNPGTHRSQRQIVSDLRVSRTSVRRMITNK